jgi:hypothetical protein
MNNTFQDIRDRVDHVEDLDRIGRETCRTHKVALCEAIESGDYSLACNVARIVRNRMAGGSLAKEDYATVNYIEGFRRPVTLCDGRQFGKPVEQSDGTKEGAM